MRLEFARIRTVIEGEVYEQEVCEASAEEWAWAVESTPALAGWSLARFPSGRVVAVEPLPCVLRRVRELARVASHG